MVIVDTTVWIDYLRGVDNPHTDWLVQRIRSRRIGLTDLILCEVLQGIGDADLFAETRDEMVRHFEVFGTGGVRMATAAAHNYRTLRKHGYTVRKTIDCLIATFCLEADYELLHRDQDFDPFESLLGLQIVHPRES
jgi:predicted nucleic acid-binding protein